MLKSVEMGQVKILPGLFRERMNLNINYLKELDLRCLLQNYSFSAYLMANPRYNCIEKAYFSRQRTLIDVDYPCMVVSVQPTLYHGYKHFLAEKCLKKFCDILKIHYFCPSIEYVTGFLQIFKATQFTTTIIIEA